MSFDFEISRVDCISKENYFSYFNIKKYTPISWNTLLCPHFFSKKNFKCKIYTYAFGL